MRQTIPRKRGGRSSYAKFQVINPGKGLNNLISDSLIDDKEMSAVTNIQFVESGAASKAPGYTAVGTGLTNNPRGLGYYTDTSLNKYLLTVDGTALMYLSGSTWTTRTGASFDSSSQINMTQAQGKMFIWDGVNAGAQLDGTTLTRPTTTPSAKFSIYYGGYHIAAGTGSNVNRIYISTSTDPGDFTNANPTGGVTWDGTVVPGATGFTGTGANYVDINKDDGDKITGFAKFQDQLIIFKEKSIHGLTFDTSGVPTVQAVSKNYGCVSHRSIDNVDNDAFFLTRNGVYVLGNEPNYINVIRTNELSARVHNTIDSINSNYYTKASAIYTKYVYHLGIPTGSSTYNDTVLTYDKRFLAWSKWTHVVPEAWCSYIDSTNAENIYFTSATTNKVYQLTPTTYTADGSAISASFETKAFDLGDFSVYKRWIDVTIYFRQLLGTVSIEVLTDGGNVVKSTSVTATSLNGIGSEMWGDSMFGGDVVSSVSSTVTATNNVPYRLRIGTKARSIKLRISNARNNENFVVLAYEFTYRPYSHFVFPSVYKIQ